MIHVVTELFFDMSSLMKDVKVKLSRYRPGQALGVPSG
jgi:hypothetical protein